MSVRRTKERREGEGPRQPVHRARSCPQEENSLSQLRGSREGQGRQARPGRALQGLMMLLKFNGSSCCWGLVCLEQQEQI